MSEAAPTTAAKLRDDIDRGRTGDKVDHPDPAAAPLGTDEEAAGTPVKARAVEQARAAELTSAAPTRQSRRRLGAAWVLIGYSAMFGALMSAVLLLRW